MKKITFMFMLFILIIMGCGQKVDKEQAAIAEDLKPMAIEYVKEKYNAEYVITKYEFLPEHAGPEVTYYGHDKQDISKGYIIGIDYVDKKIVAAYSKD